MFKTEPFRQPGDLSFVGIVDMAVQQTDRQRGHPLCLQLAQRLGDSGFIQLPQHRAVAVHPLVDLDHLPGQRFGFVDREREQVGTGLFADFQQVAKAARRDERDPGAAAGQQCVGASRRAQSQVDRRQRFTERTAEHPANCQHRRFQAGIQIEHAANQRLGKRPVEHQRVAGPREAEHPERSRFRTRCGRFRRRVSRCHAEHFDLGTDPKIVDIVQRRIDRHPRARDADDRDPNPTAAEHLERPSNVPLHQKTIGEGAPHICPGLNRSHHRDNPTPRVSVQAKPLRRFLRQLNRSAARRPVPVR